MFNRKLLTVALVLSFSCHFSVAPSHAQDASGRDPGNKAPVKAVTPPTPQATPKLVPPKAVTKPVAAKPKASKSASPATIATRKPVPAPTPKKPIPPPATPTSSRLTLNAVPNAQVELAGKMSGSTGPDGKLVLNDIPLGVHPLKLTADGYERSHRSGS